MNKWLVGFIILVCSASVSVSVSAKKKGGCNTNSLAGTWNVYVTVVSSDSFSWLRCSLDIDKQGNVAAESLCTSNEGEETAVTEGALTTDKECVFTGEIVLGDDTYEVVEGTLTGNKKVVNGVGLITGPSEDEPPVEDSDLGLFTFTGAK